MVRIESSQMLPSDCSDSDLIHVKPLGDFCCGSSEGDQMVASGECGQDRHTVPLAER